MKPVPAPFFPTGRPPRSRRQCRSTYAAADETPEGTLHEGTVASSSTVRASRSRRQCRSVDAVPLRSTGRPPRSRRHIRSVDTPAALTVEETCLVTGKLLLSLISHIYVKYSIRTVPTE